MVGISVLAHCPSAAPFPETPHQTIFMTYDEESELFDGITCDRAYHYYDDDRGGWAIYTCRCIRGAKAGTL